MDGFKGHEIARMTMSGGNDAWKRFYDQHEVNKKVGRRFETASTKERYVGVVGEEWKERLACKVEGRTYVPGERKADTATNTLKTTSSSPSAAPSSIPTQSPQSARKAANEAYFARMGAANAQRPDSLPPSQGGKYAGFGGGMPVEEATGAGASARGSRSGAAGGGGIPALDDFQQDPVAALTKGFGWFTSTIGKGARQVHEGWVQPAAKTIASSDFAAQARAAAQQGFQNFQTGARSAGSQFNRFVEGGAGAAGGEAGMYSPSAHEQTQAQTQSQSQSQARSQAISSPSTARRRNDQPPPENQDFWDDFASAAEQRRNILGAQSVGLANANASASPAGKARTSTDGGAGASSTTVGGGG
ncbi:Zn finger-containing GTPase- Activating Protein for ARF, partial [Ascosphaera atra]